ncbi:MAG: hypothetical protein KBH07_06755 [Flavobacteriales bacterium]|nr:hypothetical protein [Flavobacteriales bacterium]MBP9079828.1 hypothetical protein [Flavobacteriales bacterium]
MRKAAHVLSLVLHPVWMPTLALLLAFRIDPHLTFTFSAEGQRVILGMVFVMTALFPVASMIMLWRSGMVAELAMPRRGERILPYLLTLVYFGMAYYLLRRTPNSSTTLSLFTGMVLALAADLLLTLHWKVSLHMTGIGGLVGMVLGLMVVHGVRTPLLPGLLLLAGALGTARLVVGDHTPAQVYAGAAIGVLATSGCIVFGIWY